ncbi:MAG: ATP-binding protein, partial [Delftia sp.]|nr:ATP-binding protein [Delftia sp.]
GAGVLIRGLGGVGKSTLAAQIVHELAAQDWLVVSRVGPLGPDDLLDEVGRRLRSWAMGRDGGEKLHQLGLLLSQANVDWEERFEALADHLLANKPLLVLLDNFEDNLSAADPGEAGARRLDDEDLDELLARWLAQPGRSRLVFTCRYPFVLKRHAHRRVRPFHLGPLTFAETRKLMLRLPGLDALPRGQQERAHAQVGGHPRALEYLDALLRGKARYCDVEIRLEEALAKRGIDNPT